jgi:hypothetical protein
LILIIPKVAAKFYSFEKPTTVGGEVILIWLLRNINAIH